MVRTVKSKMSGEEFIDKIKNGERDFREICIYSQKDLTKLDAYQDARRKLVESGRSSIDLSRSDLRDVQFGCMNFESCKFYGANLEGASFFDIKRPEEQRHNQLYRTWKGSNIQETHFEGANLRHAVLRNARALETSFEDADLRGSDLRSGFFLKADFTRARLTEARVYRADFAGALFSYSDLRGVQIGIAKRIAEAVYERTKVTPRESRPIVQAIQKSYFSYR